MILVGCESPQDIIAEVMAWRLFSSAGTEIAGIAPHLVLRVQAHLGLPVSCSMHIRHIRALDGHDSDADALLALTVELISEAP